MPIVLGDCTQPTIAFLQDLGHRVFGLEEFDFRSGDPVFVVANSAAASDRLNDDLWGSHGCILACINPWKLFGDSSESQAYTLGRILNCDIDAALASRASLRRRLERTSGGGLRIRTPRASLDARFTGPVEITNTDELMKPGWNYSVAEFLEIGLLNFGSEQQAGFLLSGRLSFDGIVAFKGRSDGGAGNAEVRELIDLVNHRPGKWLTVVDNVIEAVMVDGIDATELTLRCLGSTKGSHRSDAESNLKEIAFGCNPVATADVRWALNSLMNEGVHGLHLGFGLAERAAHLDFVMAGDGHDWSSLAAEQSGAALTSPSSP